jgi:hypothetical protein
MATNSNWSGDDLQSDLRATVDELEQVRTELNDLHIEADELRAERTDLLKKIADFETERSRLFTLVNAADAVRLTLRPRGRRPAFLNNYDELRKALKIPEAKAEPVPAPAPAPVPAPALEPAPKKRGKKGKAAQEVVVAPSPVVEAPTETKKAE